MFKLKSDYKPTGDQPQAIEHLTNGVLAGMKHQTLLGVTGSGKTFTMANVIRNTDKPTLVISHNKTLAAQLYQEYKQFFPENAVEYFVSYYDYYQPEAYIPQSDTYIEKDAAINEDIDKLRLSATTALMTRKDVIVVASVSAIYNLGSSKEYKKSTLTLQKGMPLRQRDLLTRLVQLFYTRSDYEFKRGTFRVTGDTIDVFPAYLDAALRIELLDDKLVGLKMINPITGKTLSLAKESDESMDATTKSILAKLNERGEFTLYPAKHYIADADRMQKGIKQIRKDLEKRVKELEKQGKAIEAYRLRQKTEYDLEMMQELGYCKGIENYSRYFDGRAPGEPPFSLLDYFPDDFLIVIDESHISVPQIRGMYNGDRARKETLIDFGFRLPSALDNRPLTLDEFLDKANRIIYTSATPGEWEIERSVEEWKRCSAINQPDNSTTLQPSNSTTLQLSNYPPTGIVEQLIRPTGLVDPEITVRGTKNQIENLIDEIIKTVNKKQRVLVTTLTKRMAEDLSDYLREQDISVQYLHSDIDTLDRVDILNSLRKGEYDVVVGINLLREGLDLPEVSLVAILDADKEGFLRSETSLIQTMGRAARHVEGRVIMYADRITGSMQRAIDEVNRRRKIQLEYNKKHGITPQSIRKPIREQIIERTPKEKTGGYGVDVRMVTGEQVASYKLQEGENSTEPANLPTSQLVTKLTHQMHRAAKELDFETAAKLRDKIRELKKAQAKK